MKQCSLADCQGFLLYLSGKTTQDHVSSEIISSDLPPVMELIKDMTGSIFGVAEI